MNILFVSDVSIQEVIGGAERVLFEQATRLARRGHAVHALTRRLPAHAAERAEIGGVVEWRYTVDERNPAAFLLSTRNNAGALFRKISNSINFDCINFHQPFSADAALRAMGNPRRIRTVYTCHSLAFEEYATRHPRPASVWGRWAHRVHLAGRKRIEGRAVAASDALIALSAFTRDKLMQNYAIPREKITIIPGGIDLARFSPADEKAAIRSRLRLPRSGPILLSVRNLVPRMGLENLIGAMPAIVRAVPEARLVIGGTGPLKDALWGQVCALDLEGAVSFAGFIPEAMLPDFYRAADIFVLPTVALEGFGLVTLEALASGIPVLGTPIGGTKEILGGFDPAFLFRDASSDAIAEKTIELLAVWRNDPEKQRQDAEKCRHFVEEHYSWETNIERTEALLRGRVA